jgi:SWI/SNF-related matrix-associated actin-dependent regulator of chromatin subfamily A member 5
VFFFFAHSAGFRVVPFFSIDIFSSSEQFDDWFNLEIDDEEAKKNMISQLHKILTPFLLRRLKVDVAK